MVVIENVRKSFGNLEVLRGVNLTVFRSEVVVIAGPSGAGKSTLLRTINGLEPIQGGQVYVDGVPMHDRKTDVRRLRQEIGFVFQHFNLYPHLTALQNVCIAPIHVRRVPRAEAERRGEELLVSLGLGDKLRSYPAELSGGQQQRVAIARALAMDPKVILFDEPTSALDPEMIKEVLDSMRQLASLGMTMIVVSHEMGFAREVCSRIAFMDGGQIVEEAPPQEFFSNPRHPRTREFLSKIL
ncbi:MAG: amino acid ABC transporter ATP-binding protein [Bacillota bacterium]|nr:amino acid ABC transporter ATP-binding protein [Bacillota bacterium]